MVLSKQLALFRPLGLLLAVTFGLGACATSDVVTRSRAHARNGHYLLAYRVLDDARNSGVTGLDEEWTEARLAWLIDESRWAIFNDHEIEALAHLAEAERMSPGHPAVAALVLRAHEKMAKRATDRGMRLVREGDLEAALLAFAEADASVPGFPAAVEGREAVRASFAQLEAKAQRHFLEALRKYPELRMIEVEFHAAAALANDPKRDDARRLHDKAQRALAEKALARGKAAEQKGAYGAALMEYRDARELDPTLEGIGDRIAHMEKEIAAAALVERAYMHVLSQRFDEARTVLAQAFDTTVLEKSRVSELMMQVRRREGELQYQQARDLELQGQKQEAKAAFEALAAAWPDGLKDEKVRISNLQLDIDGAAKAYQAGAEAEAKGDFAEAADQFATAVSYYAGYKDAQFRLAAVKARLQ